MNLRIQNPAQTEIDSSANSLSSKVSPNAKSGGAQNASSPASSAYFNIGALEDAQDTASISSAPSQLSGELPIRQDRVDALRSQIEAGTYTVNPHAVATAMFQNLFRS
jgi:flagellar biosynthesis anti-sigma factor FlgM